MTDPLPGPRQDDAERLREIHRLLHRPQGPTYGKLHTIARELLGVIDARDTEIARLRGEVERLRPVVEAAQRLQRVWQCRKDGGRTNETFLAEASLGKAINALASPQPDAGARGEGVYVASRASIPARSAMWRDLHAAGRPIISTWIDEAGEGETADFSELWSRIVREIAAANKLVLYAEEGDFPLKGALIEAGIALGLGKPVIVCLPNVELNGRTKAPIGSWIAYPNVVRIDDVKLALDWEVAPSPSPEAAPPSAEDVAQAKELLLGWMQSRPGGVYQSSIQATEFERLTEIIAQFGCDIRGATRQAGERAGREQAAQWHQSKINKLKREVTHFDNRTIWRLLQEEIERHEKAIAAIRALTPAPKS